MYIAFGIKFKIEKNFILDNQEGAKLAYSTILCVKQLRPTLSDNVPQLFQSIFQLCVLKEVDARPSFDELIVEFGSLKLVMVLLVQCLKETTLGHQFEIDSTNVPLLANEIQLLSTLRHPTIILFIGASADSQENLCLVMEYMESGDLWSILQNQTIWKEPLLRLVVMRLMLKFSYSKKFQVVKVADFGFVRLLTAEALSARGTPLWAAPEMFRSDNYTE
ncbi:kinase [Thraustotheca clavata]|uniref:Kinase n=1 Tax=Thraustotheca clavata TaxID=74557 RepID=A0A1V9ZYU1_9STRA|nr:kinase [Thraustotheca clavata]